MNTPCTPGTAPNPTKPTRAADKDWRAVAFRWKVSTAMWTIAFALMFASVVQVRGLRDAADDRWYRCLEEKTALHEKSRMARRLATELPVCECSTVTTNHCVCIFADETVLTVRFDGTSTFYSARKLP